MHAMASILIIQHHNVVRAVFREMLERADHDVVEASNGREGIEQYRLSPTDLVITDIHVPDFEDLEVIVRLRQEFPGVRILAVSTSAGKDDLLTISQLLGADTIVEDALDGEALLNAVGKIIGA
jgi:CheY-like chemotaxis protein